MPVKKLTPNQLKNQTEQFKSLGLELPKEKSKPITDISKYTFFIYGVQKIGKTTFTMQFENALHIMMEPGAKDKELYAIYPQSWDEYVEYIRLIKKEKGRYSNFIIDTVDLLWDMCTQQVCKEKGVEYLKDIGFGDGYKISERKFRDTLIDLSKMGGLIMLSHMKDKKLEKVEGDYKAYDYVHPSSEKRCSQTIEKWVDVTGYYHIKPDNNRRYLRITPGPDIDAGNRLDKFFRYSDGSPMKEIEMGESAEESFKNFKLAFENKIKKPEPKSTKKTFTIKQGVK